MNRGIVKFRLNQLAVDPSRMSSQMIKKSIACTGTIRLNRLRGDCPVKDGKEMQKTARASSDFEPLSMLYFLQLKSQWPKTLTDSSLNKKNS